MSAPDASWGLVKESERLHSRLFVLECRGVTVASASSDIQKAKKTERPRNFVGSASEYI
jgi:hypothetical protein